MLFNSTYKENLKRFEVDEVLGEVSREEYGRSPLTEIYKILNKSEVPMDKVKIHCKSIEINESGDTEQRMVFYYKRQETDEEYNKRIYDLQVKDLREFFQILAQYNSFLTMKPQIKALYEKVCVKGPAKGLLPFWQKEQLEVFFEEKSTQELVKEAYEKGLNDGEKKFKELQKKINELKE